MEATFLGLYRGTGKENGNYYKVVVLLAAVVVILAIVITV